MNKDFRVAVSFPTHPKTKKLIRRCGEASVLNLLKLWAYVAQNKPDGILKNIDSEDIEIACDWNGQCSEFYQALLDLCFIEEKDGVLIVHDWEDHNGYACHANERSEKAKKAAEARWNNKNNTTSMPVAMQNDATSNAKDMQGNAFSNAPSPSPSPSPDKSYDTNSIEYDLAEFLWSLILQNNKTTKPPDLQKWTRHIDLMIRKDGRNPEEIRKIIKLCQGDKFWFKNILSTEKLRKQYDKLYLKFIKTAPGADISEEEAIIRQYGKPI